MSSPEVTFRYAPPCHDGVIPTVKETSDELLSLLDGHRGTLRRFGLWPSFVAEYRSFLRMDWEPDSDGPWEDPERHDPSRFQTEGLDDPIWKGPSSPFSPDLAREWAQRWDGILTALAGELPIELIPECRELGSLAEIVWSLGEVGCEIDAEPHEIAPALLPYHTWIRDGVWDFRLSADECDWYRQTLRNLTTQAEAASTHGVHLQIEIWWDW